MKKYAALGKNGTPQDVAGLVSFLVSDKAQFITGAYGCCIACLSG
jgi:NAD(P)-dependent dehydrogenase (short-subunit alcohol dehydrogenase family)